MPRFKYEVRDSSGKIRSGSMEAASMNEANLLLRSGGNVPLEVTPIASGLAGVLQRLQSVSVESGPSLKDVMNFSNQLAVMIKAGISLREAIEGVAAQMTNKKFRKTLMLIKADVEAGQAFSDALAKHPKVFSPLYVNMIRASELSGNLGGMLGRIVAYLTERIETRSMVRGAMVYPGIIATFAVGTTIFLLTWVLPRFTALFEGKEQLLPTATTMLMAISAFLRGYWYLLLGGLVAAATGFAFALKTERGKATWDSLVLKMPLFKNMVQAMYIQRGMQTMGELVNAGVPMLEALDITAEISGNTRFKRLWKSVHRGVKQGDKVANPLSRQQLLPGHVVQMISAGEESGNLGEVMRDIADYYGKELKAIIKTMTAMIEPLMILVMGLIVGFIAMSIILPIFKMSTLMKHT